MLEEFPQYLTVDWLKIGGKVEGADTAQRTAVMEDVGGIVLMDELSSEEQDVPITNHFNFVHIIVSGELFKTLKVISEEVKILRELENVKHLRVEV